MASELVERRRQSVESVAIALETWGAPIGTRLAEILSAQLQPGESLDDPKLWATLLARHLRASMQPLQTADARYEAEAADDAAPRKARDDAQALVYDALVKGRDRLRGVYGAEALPLVGFAGPTPVEVTSLLAFGDQVVAALTPGRLPTLPDPRDAHVPGIVRDTLSTALRALRTAQQDVVREGRELTAASAERNTALEAQANDFSLVAQLGVSLLRMAQQDALADRLRPSARRRGLTVAEELDPAAPVAPVDPASPGKSPDPSVPGEG